ncbi:hypothetical protein ACTXT7_013783, partial [Hymenolepis weldensis]
MVFGVVSSKGEEHHDFSIFPQGLRVDADGDACIETLQTIVVKPSWIDSLANRERPY